MYKFNNTSIVTGLIKQKLHTFNLPVCKVFNSEEDLDNYINNIISTSTNSSLYTIVKKYKKNRDSLVKVTIDKNGNLTKKFLSYYDYNRSYLNLTKKLILENNIYDSYTHKYLGDYLRFERDYNNVNLLPLYNCYCNKFEQDSNYIYYYIPVKYSQKYTLCLNNIKNIYYIQTLKSDLIDIQKEFNNNYNIIKLASFKEPYLIEIDNVKNLNELGGENNLKIVLRLPKSAYTAIICLEGDFTKTSQSFINLMPNFEKENIEEYNKLDLTTYVSKLSLLQEKYSQDKISYPFADKLIEYLLDNAITQNDLISNNIIESIYNTHLRYTDIIEKLKKLYPNLTKEKLWEKARQSLGKIDGTFTNMDRLRFNRVLNDNKLINTDNSDNLFYVDKDVELALNDERYPDKLENSKSTDTIRLIYALSADGTYYIVVGYEESGNRLIVPDTYEGLPVREIAINAFKDNNSLRSVSLGENVTSIGANAFENCFSLKSIDLSGTNLNIISTKAFLNCIRLSSVVLPESITYMGEGVFSKCTSLTKITIPFVGSNANPSYVDKNTMFGWIFGQTSYSGGAQTDQYYDGHSYDPYSHCYTFYIPSTLREVTVLKGKLLAGAFNNCNYLTKITLNAPITTIGKYALSECYNLSEFNAYGALTTDDYAFDNDSKFSVINIPNGVSISYIQFTNSANYLTYVNISGYRYGLGFVNCSHLTTAILKNIGSNSISFQGCSSLTHVEVPTLTTISSHMFDGCSLLTDVDISHAISIDNYAFKDCTSLESIDIPDTTTTIGSGVFNGCTGLKRVSIGNSVTTLNSTFQNCTSIEEVIFNSPSRLTTLETTFYGCSSLANITLPSGLVRIGSSCFANCTALTSITIPSTVKYIQSGSVSYQSYAFKGCTNLEHVYFEPNSVLEIIEAEAFYGCSSLLELIIPDTVTKIGNGAFFGCSSLANVHLPASLTGSINTGTFRNCSSIPSLHIPAGVTSIGGDGTLWYCSSLTEFTFAPNSLLTSFNAEVFTYCGNISKLEMPDSLQTLSGTFYSSGLNEIVLPVSLTEIGSDVFMNSDTSSLLSVKIFYKGDSTDWANINLHSVDYSSILYYYSETEPTEAGNWWHYVDGVPTVWNVIILTYELSQNEDYYILTGYQGEGIETLNIPATKNGLPVKEIANNKFKNESTLTTISIPASIEVIGNKCFTGCGNVTSITVDSNNSYYEVINNCLIDITNGAIIKGCNDSTIPTRVDITTIGDSAFAKCEGITNIIIPDNITIIGEEAFYSCGDVDNMVLPAGLTLGNDWFNKSYIKNLYFNGDLSDWSDMMGNYGILVNPFFSEAEMIVGAVTENQEQYIQDYTKFYLLDPNGVITFNGNTYSQLININPPTTLNSASILGLVHPTSVVIPSGTTSITDYNYYCMVDLTSITIPASVTSIGAALLFNAHVASITVDVNNTIYDSRNNCNAIIETATNKLLIGCKNTIIPNTVTDIGEGAFALNVDLTSITIPANVTSIEAQAFIFCINLTEITYQGTTADWNNITLASGWNDKSAITTIHCTDGDITL